MSRFVDELKDRGVIRAALLYVGSAWIVLQVVDVIGEILNWPDSYGQFVLVVLAVGFPIATVLSWFYQFTKRGIRQESDVTDLRSVSEGTRRQSDTVIIAVLAFAVALFIAVEIYKRIQIENVEHLVELGQQQLMVRNQSSRNESAVVEAEKYFKLAIEKNENYAPAYAGLTEALGYKLIWGLMPAVDAREEIQAAFKKGMDLDSSIGALYAGQALLKWEYDNDLDTAETHFRQAIELSPDDSLGYRWYAEFLFLTRRSWEEMLPQLEKGLEILPNDPNMVRWYAMAKANLGEGGDALPKLRDSLREYPDYLGNYIQAANILKYHQGLIGESQKWFTRISKNDPESFQRRFGGECWGWLLLDDIDEVHKCTTNLQQDFKAFPKKTMIARLMYYDAIGDNDQISGLVNSLMQSGPAETVMQRDSASSEDVTRLLGGMIPDVLVDRGMGKLAREFKEWQGSHVFTDPDWEPSKDDVRTDGDIASAIINGAILYETGDKEHGDKLFDLALDRIQAEDLKDKAGYSFRQIFVLAVRGDRQGAVAYLRVTLLDEGHFEDWHRLRGPIFDQLKEDEDWQAMIAKLEARAADELAWYEEHKDEPLF